MILKLKTKYSQRDIEWAYKILGFNPTGSKYTIGGYGCLITCLCNYMNATGRDETPDTVNEKLKDGKGYTAGSGLLKWGEFLDIFDEEYVYTSPWFSNPLTDDVLMNMINWLNKGHCLVTEIDFDPILDGEQMHWILIIGIDDNGFVMHDPWTGETGNLDRYGDIRKAIYHYKVYSNTLEVEGESSLKDTEIDFDDYEGNRHTVGWYVYEWANEKKNNKDDSWSELFEAIGEVLNKWLKEQS